MRITFVTRKFGNVERNSHCDAPHITPVRVARLILDCNGVFAIKAYVGVYRRGQLYVCITSLLDKDKARHAAKLEVYVNEEPCRKRIR